MGLLKTKEEWRGQGCARACIDALEHRLTTLGITPYVFIEDFNKVSMSLFEKLGYEQTHEACWIVCLPRDTTKETS